MTAVRWVAIWEIVCSGWGGSRPAAPTDLTATAISPYAVELRWRDRSSDERGFVVEQATGTVYRRVGLVPPDSTRWVHHGLSAGRTASYRLRAFNADGISSPSATVSVTPPAAADPHLAPLDRPEPVGACTTPDQVVAAADPAETRVFRGMAFGRHRIDLILDRNSCGANCQSVLYGELGGCYREIGLVFAVPDDSGRGWTERGIDPAGWPIIVSLSHMSAFETAVVIEQVLGQRLRVVDAWRVCGGLRSVDGDPRTLDLTQLAPPYEDCQLDFGPDSG